MYSLPRAPGHPFLYWTHLPEYAECPLGALAVRLTQVIMIMIMIIMLYHIIALYMYLSLYIYIYVYIYIYMYIPDVHDHHELRVAHRHDAGPVGPG